MAVGHYNNKGVAQALTVELAHGSWTVVTSPDKGTSTNQLSGVSCPAASTAQSAAVGYFNYVVSALTDVSPQTLTEGWSGSSWAIVAAENALAPDVSVNGVSCSSSTSCAGVGSYESATGARQVFIDGLRNGAWTLASGPAQLQHEQPRLRLVPVVVGLRRRRVLRNGQDQPGAGGEALGGGVVSDA